jgi:hypothetical protein
MSLSAIGGASASLVPLDMPETLAYEPPARSNEGYSYLG